MNFFIYFFIKFFNKIIYLIFECDIKLRLFFFFKKIVIKLKNVMSNLSDFCCGECGARASEANEI